VIATARPGFVAAEERGYVVALETVITPELREVGLVRDLTQYVQNMRKKAGLKIEDHIALTLYTGEELADMLNRNRATVQAETLADRLNIETAPPPAHASDEFYREAISPTSLKKLEQYSVEVVIGKI